MSVCSERYPHCTCCCIVFECVAFGTGSRVKALVFFFVSSIIFEMITRRPIGSLCFTFKTSFKYRTSKGVHSNIISCHYFNKTSQVRYDFLGRPVDIKN